MVQAVDRRFARRDPQAGETHRAALGQRQHLNVRLGAEMGFVICTPPPYSPESNGMAESFVKSFKRDYVYLADLWTAADVLRDLPGWFDDYNRVRPHKGLRMLSPVEFRNAQLAS